jgi:enoyl-CoA hydratase/carnithine racemase
MPGMGGAQLLMRIVGPKLTSEIKMTGEYLSAARAKELKIVSMIVEDRELTQKTMEFARKISQKSTASLRVIKDSIRLSQNVGLSQGIRSERLMFRSLFSNSDKKDKVEKFLER